jgi:hypothetical protein
MESELRAFEYWEICLCDMDRNLKVVNSRVIIARLLQCDCYLWSFSNSYFFDTYSDLSSLTAVNAKPG